MNPAVVLKALGRLPMVPLSRLSTASLHPAAVEAAFNRDCLHPDFPDLEIITTDPRQLRRAFRDTFEPEISDAISGMHVRFANAVGRGSWPPGKRCHPDAYPHENYHATKVRIDVDAFRRNDSINRDVTNEEWSETVVKAKVWPSIENAVQSVDEAKRVFSYGSPAVAAFEKPEWKEAAGKRDGDPLDLFDMSTWLSLEALRRAGIFFLQVFDNSENVLEKMIPIPGGVAGYAYFNNATCNDHVTSNIDSLLTYTLVRLTALRTHEWGHNNNLRHEFASPQSAHRSIMSYAMDDPQFQGFRLQGEPYEYVEDHSWPELRTFYGGEPAKPLTEPKPPEPPTPPEPPAPPNKVRLRLELERELPAGTYELKADIDSPW